MGYWHEPRKQQSSWVFPPKPGSRVGVVFRGEDVRVAPFAGCFMRYEGERDANFGPFPPWMQDPADWFELWPHEPILASSREEARAVAASLLADVESGKLDDRFERVSFQPPVRPERVMEIEHPTHAARAVITQRLDGHYEAGYLVYAPFGRYLPAKTPSLSADLDWERGVAWPQDGAGRDLRTLADDLESAEKIARLELSQLVSEDPEIKRVDGANSEPET